MLTNSEDLSFVCACSTFCFPSRVSEKNSWRVTRLKGRRPVHVFTICLCSVVGCSSSRRWLTCTDWRSLCSPLLSWRDCRPPATALLHSSLWSVNHFVFDTLLIKKFSKSNPSWCHFWIWSCYRKLFSKCRFWPLPLWITTPSHLGGKKMNIVKVNWYQNDSYNGTKRMTLLAGDYETARETSAVVMWWGQILLSKFSCLFCNKHVITDLVQCLGSN